MFHNEGGINMKTYTIGELKRELQELGFKVAFTDSGLKCETDSTTHYLDFLSGCRVKIYSPNQKGSINMDAFKNDILRVMNQVIKSLKEVK